jgi:rhamnogalacturonyl hydrolase YesR
MNELALKSFKNLEEFCKNEEFLGWDPYDGLNSKLFQALPYIRNNRLAKLIWIQAMKKMPVNLRSLLNINKGYNPKGLALLISGYSQIARLPEFRQAAMEKIPILVEKLMSLRTTGFSGNCWGYNFDWQSRAFFQQKYHPTIVATTFAANSLIDAYEATQNEAWLNAAISSKNFILKDLNRTFNEKKHFAFSYSPSDNTSVFNASLLGSRLLSRIYSYTGEQELIDSARDAVAYCCDYQQENGAWAYSTLPFHQWIDNFHTGFNLECIYEYGIFSNDNSFEHNFNLGLNYYLDTFFDAEGRSKYYNNSLYPIDIHAPAQLIITLCKSNLLDRYKTIADSVLNWTINNMQSSKGYFYYQKRKLYTNKIPYMRWSQSWMFYGLSYYLTEDRMASPVTEKLKGNFNI